MSKTETTNTGRTSIRVFCETYDLEPTLLQVPVREQDTWDVLDHVRSVLDGLDDLQQTVRLGDIMETKGGGAAEIYRAHLWLCGSYPVNPEVTDYRWANPEYTHGDEYQTPVYDWETHVEKAAKFPTVRLTHVARRFGIERRTLSDRILRKGWNFENRARESRRRIVKTMLTTAEWSERSFNDVCRIFPVSRRSLYSWQELVAEEWEPPAMPDHKRWV